MNNRSRIYQDFIFYINKNKSICQKVYNITDKMLTRFRRSKPSKERNITYYATNKVYLFIVNYHHLNYTSALFIRKVIYPLFAIFYPFDFDLLLVGPSADNNLNILGNGLPKLGFYSYHSLAVALDAFPYSCGYVYAGYFLVNDDSCVQPQLLSRENHSHAMSETWMNWTRNTHWKWNNVYNMNKVLFSQAFHDAIDDISSNPVTKKLCAFNYSQLRKGWGDFFYVPASQIATYLRLEKIMFKYKVFLENAVPFIMQCLNASVIKNCNHGKMLQIENCVHLHPVKYSRLEEKSLCINRISNISLFERPNTWCIVCIINIYCRFVLYMYKMNSFFDF